MNNFDIDRKEAVCIFHDTIIPQVIGEITSHPTQHAFILGGQPGSGKSAFARELLREDNNTVFINGDDLRAYHPKYYGYLNDNDVEAADKTQAVCNFWIESLIRECIQKRLNFIVEGTMRTKKVPLNTALMLRNACFSIDLVVISTPYRLSLASLQYRYESIKKFGQPARFTKKESHDEAFQNIESVLSSLIDSGLFEKFYVYKRRSNGYDVKIFASDQGIEIVQYFNEGRRD
jgi:hypothetical protein